MGIARRVLDTCERVPQLEAIVEGDVRITYADLGEAVIGATRAAIPSGLRPGDRGAIWAPHAPGWVIAALGILGAGAVLVPVNTRYKGAEAAQVLGTAAVRVLFTDNEFLGNDYAGMLRGETLPELTETFAFAGAGRSWEEYLAAGT